MVDKRAAHGLPFFYDMCLLIELSSKTILERNVAVDKQAIVFQIAIHVVTII